MGKYVLCCAAVLFLGTALRAGELDGERSPFKAGKAAPPAAGVTDQKTTVGSEMDRESPEQAWRFRGGWGRGWRGYGWRGGYGSWGYGWGYGRPYFGCYTPYYYNAYAYGPFISAYPYFQPVYSGWGSYYW